MRIRRWLVLVLGSALLLSTFADAHAFVPAPVGSEPPEVRVLDLSVPLSPTGHSQGPHLRQLDVADVDGDGVDDIVAIGNALMFPMDYVVAFGGSTITTTPVRPFDTDVRAFAADDLDGDGKVDLILVGYDEACSLMRGRGDGTFEPRSELFQWDGLAVDDFEVADVNRDGRRDLILWGARGLTIARNDPTGFVQHSINPSVGSTDRMVVADFDDDGYEDVALPGDEWHGGSFTVGWGDRDCTLSRVSTCTGGIWEGARTERAEAIDFDDDGDLDLVAAAWLWPQALVRWRNEGGRRFVPLPPLPLPFTQNPLASTLADWDGNGRPELLLGVEERDAVRTYVMRCDTRSGFRAIASWLLPMPSALGSADGRMQLVAGDFDGDTRTDAAAVREQPDGFTLGLNRSDWTSALPLSTAIDVTPSAPDGLNGWYVTTPVIDLMPTRAAATYSMWDGAEEPVLRDGPFSALEGDHVLHFFSDGETTETQRSQRFKVDTVPPYGGLIAPPLTTSATCSIIASISGAAEIRFRIDDGSWGGWREGTGSSSVVLPWPNGRKSIDCEFRDEAGNVGHASAVTTRAVPVAVTRVGGADRYATSVAAARCGFTHSSSVVLVNGESFPDALSAAALAGALKAPLLLTQRGALPADVRREIERMGAQNAYVIGSEGVVSAAVESALSTLCGSVERLGGSDRYATSREVAARVAEIRGGCGTVFMVRGDSFADGLAASAVSAGTSYPIVLTPPARLSPEADSALATLDATRAILVGGTAAISDGVREAVADKGIVTQRVGGGDRYETASMLAALATKSGWADWRHVGVASGERFPDGLAAGAMLAEGRGVLLLTRRDIAPPAALDSLRAHRSGIEDVRVLGSANAVSSGVMGTLESSVRSTP